MSTVDYQMDSLKEVAEKVYQDAFEANNQFLILEQLRKFVKDNNQIAQYQPAFFNIVQYQILQNIYTVIGRIYDRDQESYQIYNLLDIFEHNIGQVSDIYTTNCIDEDIDKENSNYMLSEYELKYFPDEVKDLKDWSKLIDFDLDYALKHHTMRLSNAEILNLYKNILKDISEESVGALYKVRKIRNKKVAHNAIMSEATVKILKAIEVEKDEINMLIEIALKLQTYIIACITGIQKQYSYRNINDFRNMVYLIESSQINNNGTIRDGGQI